jgi:hypothetical protein
MNKPVVNRGGISFESKRNAYRGSVNISGVRYRTKYYTSKSAARKALNTLKTSLLSSNSKTVTLR